MKNLFISVPMSGFSDEQIDIIEEEMSPIGYLARSIELMDSADYFIGVDLSRTRDMTGSISLYFSQH